MIYEQSYWGLGAAKVFIEHAEILYSPVGSINRDTQDTEQPGLLGHPGYSGHTQDRS